ncbi:MAG: hypothetical protein OJF59_002198 [Cytophagales bacterium]|nr:MAG: hypothetical protein OJF59_002198 [Cytophagales bacterium]
MTFKKKYIVVATGYQGSLLRITTDIFLTSGGGCIWCV